MYAICTVNSHASNISSTHFASLRAAPSIFFCGQVSEALGLPDIRSRQWSIQEASALKGKGLFEGFDW